QCFFILMTHTVQMRFYILIYAFIMTFLYACSDEAHQLLVSGRAGQLSDVLIDTCGGMTADLLYYIYFKRRT
ncbi:MAG: VanZ family protein, partial [Erysipelotrichaceae bacterium]|nr:VanZ family protein [Erysipelotrichaceae bacterium]